MKILFFTRLFFPHIGGVEKHVLEISKELIKRGHKVTVITEDLDGTSSKEKFDEIDVYRIPVTQTWFKKFQIWYWLLKNFSLIKDADIIHCHDVFFWYLPFIFLKKKVYTTFHGYETIYPPHRKAIQIRKLSELLSRGNICIGAFIEKWYGTKADVISYGGVHPI